MYLSYDSSSATQVMEEIQSQMLGSVDPASLEGTALSAVGAIFWVAVGKEPGRRRNHSLDKVYLSI